MNTQCIPGRSPLAAGAAMALAATIIWSGNFIVSRGPGQALNPATLAFLRWATALAFLAPFAARAVLRERRALARHLPYLTLTSLLGVTIFNTLIYMAGHTTEVLNMALIATSSPIFIILFARLFLGETVTPRRLAGLGLALPGVLLIVTRGDASLLAGLTFARGDLWMILASALFAAYSILVRLKPAEIGPIAFLAAGFGIGLALLVPWAAWEMHACGLPVLTPDVLVAVLYIGIGASLLSYLFWNGAVARIGPARAGMIYYSLPLFSGLEAWLILGEPVGWFHLAGGACIIAGIALATRAPRSAPR